MRTKTRPLAILVSMVLVIAHLIAFPNHLDREPVMRVDWISELGDPDADGVGTPDGGHSRWFTLGSDFGYVDGRGEVILYRSVFHGVTMTDSHYINYGKAPQDLVLRDRYGDLIGRISARGYPLLSVTGESVFVFPPDLLGCAELGVDGREIWRVHTVSPLTSFAEGGERRVVGGVDGVLRVFDRSGREIHLHRGPGRIQVVYGCAVSADGRFVCAVFGADPHSLVLLSSSDGGYAEKLTRPLPGDARREVIVRFTLDGRFVCAEAEGGLVCTDTARERSTFVLLEGRLEALHSLGASAYAAVLRFGEGSDAAREAYVMVAPGSLIARYRIIGDTHFLRSLSTGGGEENAAILVGQAGLLARVELMYL